MNSRCHTYYDDVTNIPLFFLSSSIYANKKGVCTLRKGTNSRFNAFPIRKRSRVLLSNEFQHAAGVVASQRHFDAGVHQQGAGEYFVVQETGLSAGLDIQLAYAVVLGRVEAAQADAGYNLVHEMFHFIGEEHRLVFRIVSVHQ